MSRCRLRLLSH